MPENFERPKNLTEEGHKVFSDSEIRKFVPPEFQSDPFSYFERSGINIKKGKVKRDETGKVREDPTAVKDMVWQAEDGSQLNVVGKRVNREKAQIAKTGNPLHEFEVLTRAAEFDLPCARPIAHAEQNGEHLLIMEKIEGFRIANSREIKTALKDHNFSQKDIEDLKEQATTIMDDLKKRYEAAGILRSWALKDMVVEIDFESKKIISLIPTDWERTKLVPPGEAEK